MTNLGGAICSPLPSLILEDAVSAGKKNLFLRMFDTAMSPTGLDVSSIVVMTICAAVAIWAGFGGL